VLRRRAPSWTTRLTRAPWGALPVLRWAERITLHSPWQERPGHDGYATRHLCQPDSDTVGFEFAADW